MTERTSRYFYFFGSRKEMPEQQLAGILKHTSQYRGDLLAANADAVAEHGDFLDAEFVALLLVRARAAETKGARFGAFGGIDQFAWFLSTAATGLKNTVQAESAYREAVPVLAAISEAAVLSPNQTEELSAEKSLNETKVDDAPPHGKAS